MKRHLSTTTRRKKSTSRSIDIGLFEGYSFFLSFELPQLTTAHPLTYSRTKNLTNNRYIKVTVKTNAAVILRIPFFKLNDLKNTSHAPLLPTFIFMNAGGSHDGCARSQMILPLRTHPQHSLRGKYKRGVK